MSLAWLMIGILSNDNHFHLAEGTEIEGVEHQPGGRVATILLILGTNKVGEFTKIRFRELALQLLFPTALYLYVFHQKERSLFVFYQILTRHVSGLLQSHDVKDTGCHVCQTSVFHLGGVVVGHVDERHGVE